MLSSNRNATIWWACACDGCSTPRWWPARTRLLSLFQTKIQRTRFFFAVANKTESHSNTNNTHTLAFAWGNVDGASIPRQTGGTRVMRSQRIVITIIIPQMLQYRGINIAVRCPSGSYGSVRCLIASSLQFFARFDCVSVDSRLSTMRRGASTDFNVVISAYGLLAMSLQRCIEQDGNELQNNFTTSQSPDAGS